MVGFLRRRRTLAELEDEGEQEEAETSLLEKKVLKKRLEERLGKGSTQYFKDERGAPAWKKVKQWLKTH